MNIRQKRNLRRRLQRTMRRCENNAKSCRASGNRIWADIWAQQMHHLNMQIRY